MNSENKIYETNEETTELKENANTEAVELQDEEMPDVSAGIYYPFPAPEPLTYTICPKCKCRAFQSRLSKCHHCGYTIQPKPQA